MCSNCRPFLTAQSEGLVHSVFHSALNFVVDNQFFTLLSGGLGLSPYSVVLGEETDFTLMAQHGDSIYANHGVLSLREQEVDLRDATPTNLYVEGVGILSDRGVPRSFLAAVLEEIEQHPRGGDGVAPLITTMFSHSGINLAPNHLTTFLAPRLEKVMEAVKGCHAMEAVEKLSSLAGAGIGLTPSTDDFIVGVIAALYRSAYRGEREYSQVKALAEGLYSGAKEKTVEISSHYIWVASTGCFNENLRELITTDFSLVAIKDFRENLKQILDYGSSSGSDMLTGYYFGLQMLEKQGGNC